MSQEESFSLKVYKFLGGIPDPIEHKKVIKKYNDKTNLGKTHNILKSIFSNGDSNYYDSEFIVNKNKKLFFPNGSPTLSARKRKEEIISKSLAQGWRRGIFERVKDILNPKKYIYRFLNIEE